MDWIPVVSQVKSAVQAVSGDAEGALKTQENFTKQCPVVSQVRSAVEATRGDLNAARQTQLEFVSLVSNMVNSVPVIGHIKGGIHYACGDKEGGDQAMKSSSRTVGVAGAGVAGFFVAGPVGAVVGGIAGGAAMDGLTTGVDSIVHEKYKPNGFLQTIDSVKNDEGHRAGHAFDLVGGVAFDGLAGYGAGRAAGKIQTRIANKQTVAASGAPLKLAGEFLDQVEAEAVHEAGKPLPVSKSSLKLSTLRAAGSTVAGMLAPKLRDALNSWSSQLAEKFLKELTPDKLAQLANYKYPVFVNSNGQLQVKEILKSIGLENNDFLKRLIIYDSLDNDAPVTVRPNFKQPSLSTLDSNLIFEFHDRASSITCPDVNLKINNPEGRKLNYSFYSFISHGVFGDEGSEQFFALPENVEIWFFAQEGDLLEVKHYVDVVFGYFDRLTNNQDDVNGDISFDRKYVHNLEILAGGGLCRDFNLVEFNRDELQLVASFRDTSDQVAGLGRLYPDAYNYGYINSNGTRFKRLSDVVSCVEQLTQNRNADEKVILSVYYCSRMLTTTGPN